MTGTFLCFLYHLSCAAGAYIYLVSMVILIEMLANGAEIGHHAELLSMLITQLSLALTILIMGHLKLFHLEVHGDVGMVSPSAA